MRFDESYVARRRFLCGMLSGGAVALGAAIAAPTVPYVLNLHRVPPPPFLVLDLADHDLPPGSSKIIMYGRIPALLFKTPEPDSTLKAFVATCTHFDCTVGYRPDKNCIFCACHEGCYDTDGRVVSGPPPRPLRQFHLRLRDDKLILALEQDDLERAFADPKS